MKYLTIIVVLLTVVGCTSTPKVARTWIDKDFHSKDLSGVLVVAVAENAKLRIMFENDYVSELKKQGVNAHASHILGLERFKPDNVVAIAEKQGLDTVLVTNYIGTTGHDVYRADTYYFGGAMEISSDGDSTSTYGYSYQVDGPDSYYTTNKYIILATSLYEVSTRKMLWNTLSSAQLAGDPVNLFVPFIKNFVGQAKKDKMIK